MIRFALLLLLLVPWMGAAAAAQWVSSEHEADDQGGASEEEEPLSEEEILRRNKERWERMTPEEREEALRRLREFENLSEEEKEKLRREGRSLGHLSPQERESLARKLERYRLLLGEMHSRFPKDLLRKIEALEAADRRSVDRYIVSQVMRTQLETVLDLLPKEARRRIDRMPPAEREKAIRLAFENYRRAILARMPERERKRIAALPEEERKEARKAYVSREIDQRRVETVSRELIPELREILKLSPKERRERLRRELHRFHSHRRFPPDFPWPSHEEWRKLREMSHTEQKTFWRELKRKWLESHDLPDEEIEGLLSLPVDEFWNRLRETRPELWDEPRGGGRPGMGGRFGPWRGRGGRR
jgi:hypothetical protein